MEASHAKRRQAVRPQRRGPRQYRRSGTRQPAGRGPGPDHAVLHQRPGIDARSLPDDQHRQHVGQCRPQPVPPDHRQAAAPARPHRPGHSGSRSAAAAPRQDEEAARGHALRLQGARGPCRDHVSVGQQAPDPRSRQLRPHAARHALCRVRRAGGLGQGHRRFLSQGLRDAGQRRRDGRHAGGARVGRSLAGAGVPRDQVEARGL